MIKELGLQSIARAIRYPIATSACVVVTAILGTLLKYLADDVSLNYAGTLVLGSSLGILSTLVCIALMVMDDDDLPDLSRLARTTMWLSLSCGVGLSLPIVGLGLLVPDWAWNDALYSWIPDHFPYFCSAFGPVLLFGMLPALLVAWPIRARHDTEMSAAISYVWQNIEDRRYSQFRMTLLFGGIGAILCVTPVLALLAPALVSQLAVTTFKFVEGDIIIEEDTAR